MDHNHQPNPMPEHSTMPQHEGMANHDHHAMMIADFRRRFIVSACITVPVMLLSPMIQMWFSINIHFAGAGYVLAALSTFVYFYGGWPFLTGWFGEMKKLNPGMMTLIGVAITAAFVYSIATVFGLQGADFFWELCTLILVMLLGHWIEMHSVAGASRELDLLVRLMPDVAHIKTGDTLTDVKTNTLKAGDYIIIKPGEKIAADGVITDGESHVNEAMLTGESVPVKRVLNDKVIAGSLNGEGALTVHVVHTGNDLYLSKVVQLVHDAQAAKSNTQLLADKASRVLTIVALASGFMTFAYWKYIDVHSLAYALERMVTVIVICCPHALGLAVPLVVARSTSLAARHGLLIKSRTAFEDSRRITTMVFDKTGTLTMGRFAVSQLVAVNSIYTTDDVLRMAAALEQFSEHPIATGIMLKAKAVPLAIPAAEGFKNTPGKGIEGIVEGKKIAVVSLHYLTENNIPLPATYTPAEASTTVCVMVDNTPMGYITLADEVRPESAHAIAQLHEHGIKSYLLTGDNATVAKHVSDTLKMDGYFAEVLPHQKLDKIKELQTKGAFVGMAGDGVNDAPALAQADVGIAIGSGSDIAAETAGIILVNSNPEDIAALVLFGKATHRKMIQNLWWATGYNVVAMPLAAGVLYHYGILLSPAAGAVLMSLSTVIVAFNARLLKM